MSAIGPRATSIAISGSIDTELPAQAALADATANPTTTSVGSYIHVFNGTTWDRARGTIANGLLVNLGANNNVTVTGSVTANAGTNLNTSLLALEAGGNLALVAASVSVMDDWDETDRCKVNPIVGQAGVAGGSGVVGATTQRVVLATDVGLPTGSNTIGNISTVATVTTVTTVSTVTAVSDAQVQGKAAEDAVLSGNPVRTGVRASRAVPTSMSADGDVVTPWGDREGRQVVKNQCGTGTQTSVAGSATNITLLAANTQRLGASIYNDSTALLYVRFQATATTSNFSVKMQPDSLLLVPCGYTGIIDGIWSSATGSARVSEFT